MPIDSVRDGSLDEGSAYTASCRSSTLVNEPGVSSSGDAEKITDLDWYRELPVTECVEVSLRRLSRKGGGDFLVLVLRDQSVCCFGPEGEVFGDSLSLTLPPFGENGPSGMVFYPSSHLLELDRISITLVKLSFSHQPRDLIELVQIRHGVQSNLAVQPGVPDLAAWVTLLLFARTFCDWENDFATQQRWGEVVDAAVPAPAATADPGARPSVAKRLSLTPSASPQSVESGLRIYKHIHGALFTEWESVKKAMAGTCLHASLADEIYSSLSSSIGASEQAWGIRSATIAAQNAARSAARDLATEASYDVAWGSSLALAELEDDVIGRAGLSYMADHMYSERGVPLSEQAEAMRVISEGAQEATQPGWMVGCDAGWVVGWRAGRRAARLFVWDKFEDEFPVVEWSEDQDAGWDEAWDDASLSDMMEAGPNVSSELPGRAEYNKAWDDGWSVGGQAGFEVGWESGREGARRAAVKSWRLARAAAAKAASKKFQENLAYWGLSGEMERVDKISVLGTGLSPREGWDMALKRSWDRAWRNGSNARRPVCADIARRIMDQVEQTAYSPEVIVYWQKSYIMDHISSYFTSNTKGKGGNEAVTIVNCIWNQTRDTP
ncbi:hypothetical protein FRC10_004718 [Ceratobasidium sp. 414]|nr:hypothetical protein FRC10_004718 [Ceratobasidium sp. 414]